MAHALWFLEGFGACFACWVLVAFVCVLGNRQRVPATPRAAGLGPVRRHVSQPAWGVGRSAALRDQQPVRRDTWKNAEDHFWGK
jgi:hypothetical protein